MTIWQFILQSPLTWLFITLLTFRGMVTLNRHCKGHPLANPIILSNGFIITLLLATGTSYTTYFSGAQYVHFLLGPATVALAVPLYAQLPRLQKALGPLLIALLIGGSVGIISGVGSGMLFGLDRELLLTLAPRSVTTPIAMGIAEHIGGVPQLASVLVILTGMLACVLSVPLLQRWKWDSDIVLGFSTGIAGHGIGTARAFQISAGAGAFAGLAMGLNGVITAVLVPFLLWLTKL